MCMLRIVYCPLQSCEINYDAHTNIGVGSNLAENFDKMLVKLF